VISQETSQLSQLALRMTAASAIVASAGK